MNIPNVHFATNEKPSLRLDLNMGTVHGLPEWSTGPKCEGAAFYEAVRDAGFAGVQGGDIALARSAGLGVTGSSRVNRPGEALDLARQWQDAGLDCVTLHVGTELYSDEEMFAVAEDVVAASDRTGFPLYIETHRATITQDIWRTVQLVTRLPEIRFNGDFSHWYCGCEMIYGDLEAKFDLLAPVFERVRHFHGRIASPGCMQVGIGDGNPDFIAHFREMWTRGFVGFLRTAAPGDAICFAPEILPGPNYARLFPGPDGMLREETDRWAEALKMNAIAAACFAEAERRVSAA